MDTSLDAHCEELIGRLDKLDPEVIDHALAVAHRVDVEGQEVEPVALARAAAHMASRAHGNPTLALDIYEVLLAHEPVATVREGVARLHWLRAANEEYAS